MWWNYAIPLLTAILALLQLVKDWSAHQATWRRGLILASITLLGSIGIIAAYKTAQRANDQVSTIKALTTAVQTANANQVQNTKVFTDSIERFSSKLGTLEADVKTADLRDEADHLRSELTKTQKALVVPQAVLTPGIVASADKYDDLQLSTALLVPLGHPVKFDVSLINNSGVSAHGGSFLLRICNECKFHSEPPGFTHVSGQPDFERTLAFDRVSTGMKIQTIPIEVDLPDKYTQLGVAFKATCDNCVDGGWKLAKINITRLGTAVPKVSLRPATINTN